MQSPQGSGNTALAAGIGGGVGFLLLVLVAAAFIHRRKQQALSRKASEWGNFPKRRVTRNFANAFSWDKQEDGAVNPLAHQQERSVPLASFHGGL